MNQTPIISAKEANVTTSTRAKEALARWISVRFGYGDPDAPRPCDPNGCCPELHASHIQDKSWELWEDDANDIINILSAAGYAVVPKEPTKAMLLDAVDAWHAAERLLDEDFEAIWMAMVDSSQKGSQ